MKILITGGNGFLGRNTTEYFLNKNYEVMVLSKNTNNIQHILNKIEFIKSEDVDYIKYTNQIIRFSPDVVIHFAWDGGNNNNNINDINQFYKNIPCSLSLLEIINKCTNKPKFIGVGSFAEYGNIISKAEESQTENPVTFYGLSKNIFKNISEMYCEQNLIEWAWIRPCYIYGFGDVSTRLIPSVINNLLQNKKISLDMCNKTIDYLHIYDFCSAISSIIDTKINGIVNICSGIEYNLKDIINNIENKIQKNGLIDYN